MLPIEGFIVVIEEESTLSEGEQSDRRATRLERKDQRAEQKAQKQFERSHPGRAFDAWERGDQFFQIELPVSQLVGQGSSFGSSTNVRRGVRGGTDILGQIEEQGWALEHVGYVFIETGSTSTNRVLSTGQGTVTRGSLTGVYLFRRAERITSGDPDVDDLV